MLQEIIKKQEKKRKGRNNIAKVKVAQAILHASYQATSKICLKRRQIIIIYHTLLTQKYRVVKASRGMGCP